MNLRQQLQLKRALRYLRTWAPPISIGVIVGAGAFILADHAGRPTATAEPVAMEVAQTVEAPPVRYRNCDAARSAGVTPIHRGQPGYSRRLDADHDGIACEPHEHASEPRTQTPETAPRNLHRASMPTAAYPSCARARAAGAAPLYRGDAGYNEHLDRDNDGVACELHR